jgi:hypothetical protein
MHAPAHEDLNFDPDSAGIWKQRARIHRHMLLLGLGWPALSVRSHASKQTQKGRLVWLVLLVGRSNPGMSFAGTRRPGPGPPRGPSFWLSLVWSGLPAAACCLWRQLHAVTACSVLLLVGCSSSSRCFCGRDSAAPPGPCPSLRATTSCS